MSKNMYNFTGPLDPVAHRLVCIPRSKELDRVIGGILQGEYWVILGPRQVGKTTFLRQLKKELDVYPGIYFDLESSPREDEAFYRFIITTIQERFAGEEGVEVSTPIAGDMGHQMNFYNFLKIFRPGKDKKIILFFDEIEKAPSVHSFLNTWRKVFHERMDHHELKKYVLVIAGSVDLIPLTIGPTSPFNIARRLYINHFSREESEKLIVEPFEELGLEISPEGREKIISRTSGHPQLLQHLCHALVEQAWEEQREITAADVENAIEEKLYIESDNLKTLEQQIAGDATLKELVTRVLNREKVRYSQYQKYSLTGVGPIASEDKYCSFRCQIYEKFLEQLPETACTPSQAAAPMAPIPEESAIPLRETVPTEEITFKTIIYLHEEPGNFSSGEEEDKFLNKLFRCGTLTVEIEKGGRGKKLLEMEGKAKLIFSYLAYKNYKALEKEGHSDWKSIPDSYKYRLASNPQNNADHQEEWHSFMKYFEEIGEKKPVDQDIRQWKFALQKILEPMHLEDIIDSKKSGRGGGYLLKGTVEFRGTKTH